MYVIYFRLCRDKACLVSTVIVKKNIKKRDLLRKQQIPLFQVLSNGQIAYVRITSLCHHHQLPLRIPAEIINENLRCESKMNLFIMQQFYIETI
jgi:hypothetical protein